MRVPLGGSVLGGLGLMQEGLHEWREIGVGGSWVSERGVGTTFLASTVGKSYKASICPEISRKSDMVLAPRPFFFFFLGFLSASS